MRALPLLVLAACTQPLPPSAATPSVPTSSEGTPSTTPSTTTPSTPTPSTTPSTKGCGEPGNACDPFVIASFPYTDQRSTTDSPWLDVDAYACDPTIDESGPEFWYTFTLAEAGRLTAGIDETAGDDVDVDVHLLDAAKPEACVARDHVSVSTVLEPGTYFLVIDTWVDGDGVPQDGPYALTVDFTATGDVDCSYVPTDVRMFWNSCAVADCFTSGGDVFLATPTVGPVVKEAHLVTVDDAFGGGWPNSFTDQISAHYALSEAATGYAMSRREPWAPAGEGGSEYGQSAYSQPLPVEDEAWYINMYWRSRPSPGTRMLVRANGRTVVAAAGYETGPGANTAVAGVAEEIHDYLGTGHLDELEIGFANDPTLPLGPLDCP